MKYIPLANLKNTTGIVAFCKEAKELVVANRNGLPKLVLMSREVYENGLGRLTDRVLLNVHRDMELVAEPVLIRTFNNPAEIVRICEKEMGKVVQLRVLGPVAPRPLKNQVKSTVSSFFNFSAKIGRLELFQASFFRIMFV